MLTELGCDFEVNPNIGIYFCRLMLMLKLERLIYQNFYHLSATRQAIQYKVQILKYDMKWFVSKKAAKPHSTICQSIVFSV